MKSIRALCVLGFVFALQDSASTAQGAVVLFRDASAYKTWSEPLSLSLFEAFEGFRTGGVGSLQFAAFPNADIVATIRANVSELFVLDRAGNKAISTFFQNTGLTVFPGFRPVDNRWFNLFSANVFSTTIIGAQQNARIKMSVGESDFHSMTINTTTFDFDAASQDSFVGLVSNKAISFVSFEIDSAVSGNGHFATVDNIQLARGVPEPNLACAMLFAMSIFGLRSRMRTFSESRRY